MRKYYFVLIPLGVVSRFWEKDNINKIKKQNVNCKIVEAFRHLFRTDFSARLRLGRNDSLRGSKKIVAIRMRYRYNTEV